jgi:hypothetical protein
MIHRAQERYEINVSPDRDFRITNTLFALIYAQGRRRTEAKVR